MNTIKEKIEAIIENPNDFSNHEIKLILEDFVKQLEQGTIRSAEPTNIGWTVNIWIKKGILLLFKYGKIADYSINKNFPYFDKDIIPSRNFSIDSGVRIVPGGSTIRAGAYVAKSVVCMPPMYINIGSYVDEGTMIDSHALVGACAQIGKRVHVSAAAQIGGVLEPAGSRPVIIEDDVLIGGNCGVYEGIRVCKRAVLASGVILTASVKVYDLVNEREISSKDGSPLEIPEGAVVVPGSRKLKGKFAEELGLSISAPMIIKYRDERTDAKTALEQALR